MSWTDQYSALDRFVHDLAFAGTSLQKAVAEIEDQVFSAEYSHLNSQRPVFITSLPRAGTTLMLELLASLPDLASHTYRNMPFLLCPIIWNRLSRGFQKKAVARERAHADGMSIDLDSAEAFEEALWQAWWPDKYAADQIALWNGFEDNEEFNLFFDNHLKKIAALGCSRDRNKKTRYISKNNNNVARLPSLARLYPDCRIIIPVREPVSHVHSLHRQHMRFLKVHDEDAFARRYMAAIGHHEFGANLKTIGFPGFDQAPDAAVHPAFWLDYWIAAYSMIAQLQLPQIRIVNFDHLCHDPASELARILNWLGVGCADDIARLAGQVTMPSSKNESRSIAAAPFARDRLAIAQDIFSTLTERASVPDGQVRRFSPC